MTGKIFRDTYSVSIYCMKQISIGVILFIIAGWILGLFIYSLMALIHLLIILAIISLLLGIKTKT